MKSALRLVVAVLSLTAFAAIAHAAPVTYSLDKAHTEVGFEVRHFFSKVHGNFTNFEGTITFDEASPANIVVNTSAETKSINTGNERRDNHLRSGDFFAADSFPQLTFKSTKVTLVKKGTYKVAGDLTMRGVTKPVVFDAEYLGAGSTGMGVKAGFSATTVVNRKDFNINWNKVLDNGSLMLDDKVTIVLNIEGNGAEAPKK
jgi:polyisoprenoid-binding protein YceI